MKMGIDQRGEVDAAGATEVADIVKCDEEEGHRAPRSSAEDDLVVDGRDREFKRSNAAPA